MMGCRRWRILTPADQQESFASRLWELLVRSSKATLVTQHLCLQDTSSYVATQLSKPESIYLLESRSS